jgi:preprotein translocase subunit YajC
VQGAGQLVFFVAIAAVFWFLLIRPQRRRQQELAATQQMVELGDEVMLGAGIYGVVAAADDEFFELEVSSGARMKVARASVVRIVTSEHDEPGAGAIDPTVAASNDPGTDPTIDPDTDLATDPTIDPQGPTGPTPGH